MQNNFITQTRTSTPTTEIRTFDVGTFWKSNNHGIENFYAIVAPDSIINVTTISGFVHKVVSARTHLTSADCLEIQIEADEFSAEYEAAQLAIVDAFQTAFPQAVNLEMSER